MLNAMLTALFPVAFIITLGWIGGNRGYFQHSDATTLATLVMRFALPFSLFLGAIHTTPDKLQNVPFVLTMILGLMGTFLISLVVARFVFRHDLKTSTIQALVCAFPDMAYFGAPVLAVVCGPSGFLAVLVGNLITSIFMLPLTIILTRYAEGTPEGEKQQSVASVLGQSVWKAVTNPMVWLPVTGAILSFAGFKLPGVLDHSVELMAKSAGGVSLFALGLLFCGERAKVNADVITNIGMKNFLMPALMLLGVYVFKVQHDLAVQALITGSVPTAVAASMFAIRNRTYAIDASASVLIGTVLGIGTVGAMVAMLH
ncbi:AEC family transporter [Paludibacterium yongneupense]|uniref:AEC family transporter n=1 Tax=Paludibacterium yongneupense TaxID=400061 RepID=UPI00040C9D92|nr:AEC family transporter [Paludibacterium yongneupense]